jgi:hypothetical protein
MVSSVTSSLTWALSHWRSGAFSGEAASGTQGTTTTSGGTPIRAS